jgi:hypothetical protein
VKENGQSTAAKRWRAWALGLLFTLVAVFHAPGLWTGFLSDDYMIIGNLHRVGVLQVWVRPFLDLSSVLFYRPLLNTSYGFDMALWDLNPWGYHFQNLLLHLVVTWLCFQVGRRLTRSWWVGFLAAALVGLDPLNPNTVTWIAGRVSLLGSLFSLIAILAFLGYRRRPTRLNAATTVGALIAGLFAKESSIVVPFFLLLADRILPRPRVRVQLHLALWALLAGYFAVRYAVLGFVIGGYGAAGTVEPARPMRHVLELLDSILTALAPFRSFDGSHPWVVWPVLAVVLLGAARWLKRGAPGGRAVVVALLWAGAMAALIYPAWELRPANAERWYPALLGSALVLAIVLGRAGRWGPGIVLVLVGLGLPALWNREHAYRETGARVHRLVSVARSVPVERLFVFNLPLIRAGAPFLHHGLADALAPPFSRRLHGVFPVHAPFTRVGGELNPAALVLARQIRRETLAVLLCDHDGRVGTPVDRDYLLAYPGFAAFRSVPHLTWGATIEHEPVGGIRLRIDAYGATRLTVDVFSSAGVVRLEDTVPENGVWETLLGPAFKDYLGYPLEYPWRNGRGYFVAITWDSTGAMCGLDGGGLPNWQHGW